MIELRPGTKRVEIVEGQYMALLISQMNLLPELLEDEAGWQSLDVDYEPPRVERIWRQIDDDHRLYLHRIHACKKALYHPHPWPSAVALLDGGYKMGVGFGPGEDEPPIAMTTYLVAGAAYEMIHLDGWHYVEPSEPVLSVMVTGPRWNRWSPGPRPDQKLGPLSDKDKKQLIYDFKSVLSSISQGGAGAV